MRRLSGVIVALLCAWGVAATAQPPQMPGAIEALKPGGSLWAPQIAPEGPVTIVVSIPLQRAYVYRNGAPIAVTTVSTGKRGHATPVGVFTILQKKREHRSSVYDDAPMPFMQRLTWKGVALHAGVLPGYPASHGCIRLPRDFAERLFAITQTGATVIVTDQDVTPVASPVALALDAPADRHVSADDYFWSPERSPTGPLSIVVSGRDRRMIVLRNGKEIGSAAIVIDVPIATTTAYALRAIDAEGAHWVRLPLPGGPSGAGVELRAEEHALGHLPAGFRQALKTILAPGATMLVTRDTLASSGIGTKLRVMDDGGVEAR
jgi:hypothetical protein